jgi:phosphoglycolate phosphatase-like HAD superfamily hydrolase
MHAVLFDIDGTLIDTRGAGRAAISLAFRDAFGHDDVRNIPFAGRTDRAIASDLFRRHRLENSAENWQRLAAGYLRHLPEQLVRRRGRTLPGVLELLEALASRENWARFRFGAYGDEHLDRDAVAAEALAHATAHAQLSADRILVIGDTPLDIRCARHIGAKVIAVATGTHRREELAAFQPDVLVDDLADTRQFRFANSRNWLIAARRVFRELALPARYGRSNATSRATAASMSNCRSRARSLRKRISRNRSSCSALSASSYSNNSSRVCSSVQNSGPE